MKRSFVVYLLAVTFTVAYGASCTGPSSGLTNLWSALYAGQNDVVIPSGQSVKMDVSATLNSITITGSLVWDDTKDINLTARWVRVNSGGSFIIGSESCPYTNKAYITFTGQNTTVSEMGTEPSDGSALGTKGIAITSGGNLEVHGATVSTSWTRLSATAVSGTSMIVVEKAPGWSVGDMIVIASTDFGPTWEHNDVGTGEMSVPEQSEYRMIAAISGNTITLNSPLNYTHWGQDYERAEVGLLSRRIVFNGDAASDGYNQFGGQVMIRAANTAKISGAEFTRMGQKGVLGRYPVHFHMMGDQIGRNIYIKDSSIHHNYQRCVTIHDSNGILVQNNVAFDTIGHCYFLEDGPERKNTFNGNLGIFARYGSLLLNDKDASIFWITNPDNTYTDNVAVGGRHGFWYSLPTHPIGASQAKYNTSDTVWPIMTPLLLFSDNVAHGQDRNGLMVDEMVQMDDTTPLASYDPRQGPYNTSFAIWQYIPVPATFQNFIAYKCRDHGVWTRGSYIRVYNTTLLDNTNGILCVPGPSFVDTSLIVGETDNIGLVIHYSWLDDFPRARPVPWTNNYPIGGLGSYDAGGPQFAKDIIFKNFTTNSFRSAGALFILPNGKNMLAPMNKFTNFKFINANVMWIQDYPNNFSKASLLADGPKAECIQDLDGSITGTIGGWIVSTESILVTPSCVLHNEWNAYYCPPTMDAYVQIQVNNEDASFNNWGTTVSGQEYVRATWYPLGNQNSYLNVTGGDADYNIRDRWTANVIPRRGYTIRFPHPTPPKISVTMTGGSKGTWVDVAIPFPSTTFTIRTGYAQTLFTAAASRDQIDKYHYYYDSAAKLLYVRIQNTDDDTVSNQWGFPDYDSYNSYINIVAGCTTCDVSGSIGASPNPPIPSAKIDAEDRYQAALGGCVMVPSVTSANGGYAFFSYNPTSKELSYTIPHSIFGATSAALHTGAAGSATSIAISLASAMSPIQGSVFLSREKHVHLWNGNLSVVLTSPAFPNGELRGQIGCAEASCTPPPQTSVVDPCSPLGDSIVVYNDSLQGWDSWSYPAGININFTSTNAQLCGSRVISLPLSNWAAMSLHASSLTIDTTVYKYFQFYAKTANPLDPVFLTVRFANESDTIGTVEVTSDYISNFVIEGSWTRVRIPLSAAGFAASQLVYRIDIYQTGDQTLRVFYIDEIRFTQDITEPLTPLITGSAVSYAADACISAATSASASGTVSGTVSGTSSATGTATGLGGSSTITGSTSGTAPGTVSGTSSATGTGAVSATANPTSTGSGNQYPNGNEINGSSQGSNDKTVIIASSVAGGVALLLVAVLIAVCIIKKRRNSPSSYNDYHATSSPSYNNNTSLSNTNTPVQIVSMNTIQSSMKTAWSNEPATSTRVPPTPAPTSAFGVGQTCLARYTGDGQVYRARILQVQGGQYLVQYVDFGNDTEWLPASSLKSL